MKNSNDIVACTSGTSNLMRAKFGPGMLLRHDDLEQLNAYPRELSRLLFRSLFGCGVVCGLEVTATMDACGKTTVNVTPGVALACSGDPIWVPKGESLQTKEACDENPWRPLWVILCAKVKQCAPRTSMCSSDDDETTSECTREKDGYEIRVVREDESGKKPCGCGSRSQTDQEADERRPIWNTPCKCVDPDLSLYKDHYAGKCGCNCGECTDCGCDCVLLARLDGREGDTDRWLANYEHRRFVRPVLMRDPKTERTNASTPVPTESHMQQRIEFAARATAEETVKQVAEKAAQQAAQKAIAKIAKEMGEKAAKDILSKINPKEVASEAIIRAVNEAKEQAASKPAETVPAAAQPAPAPVTATPAPAPATPAPTPAVGQPTEGTAEGKYKK